MPSKSVCSKGACKRMAMSTSREHRISSVITNNPYLHGDGDGDDGDGDSDDDAYDHDVEHKQG
jgi:hypothetical protein